MVSYPTHTHAYTRILVHSREFHSICILTHIHHCILSIHMHSCWLCILVCHLLGTLRTQRAFRCIHMHSDAFTYLQTHSNMDLLHYGGMRMCVYVRSAVRATDACIQARCIHFAFRCILVHFGAFTACCILTSLHSPYIHLREDIMQPNAARRECSEE